jgi:peptidoglycan/LPS O-acetylase OafA/YrhL
VAVRGTTADLIAGVPETEAEAAARPGLAPPPGNLRFPHLDGIRGLAAMTVLVVHGLTNTAVTVSQFRSPWVHAVFTARIVLPLFFMLSGFLLYRPFVSARVRGRPLPSIRAFWMRRALRLLPAYWVALTLMAIWPGLPGVFSSHWWAYYGFVYVYRESTVNGGLVPAWTLCVDFTLYLVLPFYAMAMAAGLRRASAQRAVAIELGLLAIGWVVGNVYWFLLLSHVNAQSTLAQVRSSNLIANLDWLAFGMAFAVLSVADRERPTLLTRLLMRRGAVAISWGAALAAYVVLSVFIFHVSPPVEHLLAGVICACVFAPAALVGGRGGPLLRVLDNRVVAWCALVSFGLYLYHPAVLEELYKWGVHINADGAATYFSLTAAAIIVALTLGALSYYLLERPFLRLKRTVGPVKQAAAGGAVAGPDQTTRRQP